MDINQERTAQKVGNSYRVPSDPDKLVSWLEQKREQGKTRLPERQMKLNLAYVLGEQWVVWDQDKRQFRRPSNAKNDPNAPIRVTANKIGGIVEHYISRLTKSNQEPDARPVSDDDDDVASAKVATRILHSEMDRVKFKESITTDLYFWVTTLGWSYLQVMWDAGAGPEVLQDEEGQPVHQGEISIDVCPGFEVGIDPNSKRRDLTDARWAVRSVSMTLEACYEVYGKVPVGDTARSLADEVYDLVEGVSDTRKEKGDIITVNQFWLRPGNRSKPEGMVVTWAGTTILDGPYPFPYTHGRLPFIQYDLLPGMGTREGRTWVKDLVPLQADYNDARSREAAIRRTLTPKLLAPTGSIDPRRMTSRVEVVTYNPIGTEPHWSIPDSGWMNQYEAAMARADTEMGERAGQSDASSGDASPNMPAAAILALQEADDTRLAIPAKLMAQATAQVGWHILGLARQYWQEERIVRTWSADGDIEVERFMGSDVSNTLDIRVSAESSLPRSKSARTQLAMELWGEQIITDPRTYVRLLDLPGTDFLTQSLNKDAKRAQRENSDLLKGIPRKVELFDNHSVHLTEHDDVRKSEEYERLSPQAKAVFDAHCGIHESLALGQMASPVAPGDFDPEAVAQTGAAPTSPLGGSMYLDPMTGAPPNGMDVASGQAPSAIPPSINELAGIGGPGNPGAVPGISADQQAASMGS